MVVNKHFNVLAVPTLQICGLCVVILAVVLLIAGRGFVHGIIITRKVVGVECRHDMRPSVQMPSVSGSGDSTLGPGGHRPPNLAQAPQIFGHSSSATG